MAKPLRVLVFAGYYLPHQGGYTKSLQGLLEALVAAGHVVTVVTSNVFNQSHDECLDGVRIIRLPAWHCLRGTYPVVLPSWRTFQLLHALGKEPFDVVSTQTRFFTTSFLGAFYSWMHRIPLIHTERGSRHSMVTNPLIDLLSRFIDHTLGAWVIYRARLNIGVSEAACDFLNHLGAKHIRRIPNGVVPMPPLSRAHRTILRKKWRLSPKDYVVLFVGSFIPAKGLQDLLPLVPFWLTIEPRLKLLVAGGGPGRLEHENTVARLGVRSSVKFLGLISHKQLMECLQIANLLVNPSHSEGLPRSVLEAAAAGLPIVASDAGGTCEIVLPHQTGVLFTPAHSDELSQSVIHLLTHKTLAQKLGKAARHHVRQEFSWPRIVRSYEKAFRDAFE